MKWIVIVAMAALSLPSFAQSATDALSRCIADDTTRDAGSMFTRQLERLAGRHPLHPCGTP